MSACVIGVLVAAGMFYLAGTHNPQQVFHGAAWSSLSLWLMVPVSWFLAAFCAVFALVFSVLWVGSRLAASRQA